MTYSPGALVRARGRDWVVLAHDEPEWVMVRPLGGTDDETTGILTTAEKVEPASFGLPDPRRHLGDAHSARLLRDALRLGFRSGAGPFRCIARLGCDPRPYQIVPLLMALRLDPVRLLIADDVGVGKTIEAALIASELIAQGDARRLCVLCPPHLAEQWQTELGEKFHIDAELVLASTAARLERGLAIDESIFERYPNVIVSIDFIKSDRRRDDFIRACPELVIVDEAHACVRSDEGASAGRHQRHALVSALAADPQRHMVLVTATPHSGKDAAFRSLLGLLDAGFDDLPVDLGGDANRHHRQRVARHLVQRRRSEIQDYLDAETPFPQRSETEVQYSLSPQYRTLFDQVLAYARGSLSEHRRGTREQRVRRWSALGLLRALASSPAAAAKTLNTRAFGEDADSVEDIDERGRRLILDLDDTETAPDVVPGAQTGTSGSAVSDRLRRFATQATAIAEASSQRGADTKLDRLIDTLAGLLSDGFSPIVFCRFIDTAEYVADRLKTRLPRQDRPQVAAVTGLLHPAEREARIAELAKHSPRVLVATDCLSEGINLQDCFDAVIHYDLPWNPTRLEQREGRVDRYGQPEPEVRVVTCWGADNRIDGTVLEVLLRKHRTIRSTLGISIPVPGSTSDIVEALAEQVLESADQPEQLAIEGVVEQLRPYTDALEAEWLRSADNEKRRRSLFAQSRIDPGEVHAELIKVREAIGSDNDIERFFIDALKAHGAGATPRRSPGAQVYDVDISEVSDSLLDALNSASSPNGERRISVGFGPAVGDRALALSRTHPTVAGLAAYVLDGALHSAETGSNGDSATRSAAPPVAARCGVMRTNEVGIMTTLLLCRVRMSLTATARLGDHHMLAEEAVLLAFEGTPDAPIWVPIEDAGQLLGAEPVGNVNFDAATHFIERVLDSETQWRPKLHDEADTRAAALAAAHRQVRDADRRPGTGARRVTVQAQHPADLLAAYCYLPHAQTA